MNTNVAFAAAVALLLAGCVSQPVGERVSERIILLPSDTARPSAIVVKTGDAEVVMDTPYAGVEVRGTALLSTGITPEEVERRYGGLLSAHPKKVQLFTLFFVMGTDELTPASKIAFADARKQVATWSAAEVVVIGHTDRMGSLEYNDTLSLDRARLIASQLVTAGVSADIIEIAARGKREPLVQTADGIAEPRNRRVEVKVR